MKRIVALLVSLLMLLCSVAAMAEGEKTDLFTTENGTKVTFEMEGNYNLEVVREEEGKYVIAIVSRENCEDVTIAVNPYDSDLPISMGDMSDEDINGIIESIRYEYSEFDEVSVTKEVTAAGNTYILVVAKADGIEYNERYTVFEGYEFDRIQISRNGSLTEEDKAFMNEVQAGMWVETAEAK